MNEIKVLASFIKLWRVILLKTPDGLWVRAYHGTIQAEGIHIFIEDAQFPNIYALLPNEGFLEAGSCLPGSWFWRKLQKQKLKQFLLGLNTQTVLMKLTEVSAMGSNPTASSLQS